MNKRVRLEEIDLDMNVSLNNIGLDDFVKNIKKLKKKYKDYDNLMIEFWASSGYYDDYYPTMNLTGILKTKDKR